MPKFFFFASRFILKADYIMRKAFVQAFSENEKKKNLDEKQKKKKKVGRKRSKNLFSRSVNWDKSSLADLNILSSCLPTGLMSTVDIQKWACLESLCSRRVLLPTNRPVNVRLLGISLLLLLLSTFG